MTPKTFIVTGASKGIGAAIAQRLLSHSHNVVLAARSGELLGAVKQAHPGQVEYVAGDMTDPDIPTRIVEVAVKAFGKIDGLVINHGALTPKKLSEISLEEFRHSYEVNVFSYLAMAKAALVELRKTQGTVVWLSSGAVNLNLVAWGTYSSSKSAVNVISSHFAAEEPEIISVAVEPGRCDTDIQAAVRSAGKDVMKPAEYDNFIEVFNQGGLLRPEQPGNVIAGLVAAPAKDLSGKFFSWDSPELSAYQ